MSDILILLIHDPHLRQLYHELLLSHDIEIIPVATIEESIGILATIRCTAIAIFTDDLELEAVKRYIGILHHITTHGTVRVVVMSGEPDQYTGVVGSDDTVVATSYIDPSEIALKIKHTLSSRPIRIMK